jgi:hypothetical protein
MQTTPPTPPQDSCTPSDHEELRLLYQVSVADIAFFKQQQWSTTNYALSIHAALLVIAYQLLTDKTERLATWQGWLLVVLAWSVCVIGLSVVQRLQSSILGRRTRLERVRAKFGKAFAEAWSIPKPPDDVHWLLVFVTLLSAAVVTWLVLVKL